MRNHRSRFAEMGLRRSAYGFGAALLSLICFAHPGDAQATALPARSEPGAGFAERAEAEFMRFARMTSRTRPAVLADNPLPASPRAAARAETPVITATAAGPGQAGYVHYFLIRGPDDAMEIQVGIELPDQRIAWSFPDLGAVVSPFIESGVMPAGGKDYEVWHLYGLRPFPDDAAMAALATGLVQRISPWIEARTPYCERDDLHARCMSCLGFVLRALFPGGLSSFPDLPRDFGRAGSASNYTTRDLLLFLTGMLELPTREARLQRIARLTLPDALREDLEDFVYAMGASGTAVPAHAATPKGSARKPAGAQPPKIGTRPVQRRRL